MRQPLSTELGTEDRSLARRWAITSASIYWTIAIVIIAALVMSSKADRVTVAVNPERSALLQDRSSLRPYGSLPNMVPAIAACTASRPCVGAAATDTAAR